MRVRSLATILAIALGGCSSEARQIVADQPQTPPNGPTDPRIPRYEANYYQVAQGGRYFTWYGCARCHDIAAQGVLSLSDGRWAHGGALSDVYASIASRHPEAYADRIPVEQLWQMSAFVRDLPKNDAAKNRRNALDQLGEPQAETWQGPIR